MACCSTVPSSVTAPTSAPTSPPIICAARRSPCARVMGERAPTGRRGRPSPTSRRIATIPRRGRWSSPRRRLRPSMRAVLPLLRHRPLGAPCPLCFGLLDLGHPGERQHGLGVYPGRGQRAHGRHSALVRHILLGGGFGAYVFGKLYEE